MKAHTCNNCQEKDTTHFNCKYIPIPPVDHDRVNTCPDWKEKGETFHSRLADLKANTANETRLELLGWIARLQTQQANTKETLKEVEQAYKRKQLKYQQLKDEHLGHIETMSGIYKHDTEGLYKERDGLRENLRIMTNEDNQHIKERDIALSQAAELEKCNRNQKTRLDNIGKAYHA